MCIALCVVPPGVKWINVSQMVCPLACCQVCKCWQRCSQPAEQGIRDTCKTTSCVMEFRHPVRVAVRGGLAAGLVGKEAPTLTLTAKRARGRPPPRTCTHQVRESAPGTGRALCGRHTCPSRQASKEPGHGTFVPRRFAFWNHIFCFMRQFQSLGESPHENAAKRPLCLAHTVLGPHCAD